MGGLVVWDVIPEVTKEVAASEIGVKQRKSSFNTQPIISIILDEI
jgi:hypothetical protein